MPLYGWLLGAVLLLVLLESRTARADGAIVKVHPIRRLMFFVMRGRNESQVYFEAQVDATKLLPYLEVARTAQGVNFTHLSVAAAAITIAANPRMNRFVKGRRLYQRNDRCITFSMKREKLGREASLATVKSTIEDGETLPALAKRINARISDERSGKKSTGDREIDFFDLFPRLLLLVGVPLLELLDYYGLLPKSFIDDDPMYTSMFVANLGSLNMEAAYHHLYEYGTCPIFIVIGKIEEQPVAEGGQVVIKPMLKVRCNFDERIDDGLNARYGLEVLTGVLSDPERYLGPADGSAPKALWPQMS